MIYIKLKTALPLIIRIRANWQLLAGNWRITLDTEEIWLIVSIKKLDVKVNKIPKIISLSMDLRDLAIFLLSNSFN